MLGFEKIWAKGQKSTQTNLFRVLNWQKRKIPDQWHNRVRLSSKWRIYRWRYRTLRNQWCRTRFEDFDWRGVYRSTARNMHHRLVNVCGRCMVRKSWNKYFVTCYWWICCVCQHPSIRRQRALFDANFMKDFIPRIISSVDNNPSANEVLDSLSNNKCLLMAWWHNVMLHNLSYCIIMLDKNSSNIVRNIFAQIDYITAYS